VPRCAILKQFLALVRVGLHKKEVALVIDSDINSIRCSKVEISGTKISELDGDRIVITIPREQIRQIKLSYDTNAKNPFCQYFLGFTLLSLGLIGFVVTFFASLGGISLTRARSEDFVVPLIPVTLWLMIGVGFWLLMGIFRARYHLWIDTEGGIRKIFFEKAVDIQEIQQFIKKAHLNFGYSIDVSILGKMRPSS
jgi:hypothetical protein